MRLKEAPPNNTYLKVQKNIFTFLRKIFSNLKAWRFIAAIVFVVALGSAIGFISSNNSAVSLEKIDIDINFKNYQKLAFKRKQSLERGMLFTSPDDSVPAKIRYKNKTMKASIRLKGDLQGHWEDKEKWSFRIKLKGDNRLFGLKRFSIQHPRTRHYLHEWIYHKILKREGVLGLRYQFIDVVINGKNMGVYALEEHFDKFLIENNRHREGPIFKFDEEYLWKDRLLNEYSQETDLQSFYTLNVDAFKSNTILSDPQQFKMFMTGYNKLEAFRRGELTTSQVFDVSKLARYFAIADLTGARHGAAWHNIRFYYNPITALLEPIGFDSGGGYRISYLLGFLRSDVFDPGTYYDFIESF